LFQDDRVKSLFPQCETPEDFKKHFLTFVTNTFENPFICADLKEDLIEHMCARAVQAQLSKEEIDGIF